MGEKCLIGKVRADWSPARHVAGGRGRGHGHEMARSNWSRHFVFFHYHGFNKQLNRSAYPNSLQLLNLFYNTSQISPNFPKFPQK